MNRVNRLGIVAMVGLVLAAIQFSAHGQQGDQTGAADEAQRVAQMKQLWRDRNPRSAQAMRAALKDPSAMVRRLAIYALERLRDESATADIAAMLTDNDPWVRRTAVVALGKVGGNGGAAAMAAVAANDVNIYVRFDALLSLARLKDAGTQAQVFAAMADQRLWKELTAHEQAELMGVLGESWITDAGVQPLLLKLLNTPVPNLEGLDEAKQKSALRQVQIVTEAAAAALATRFADPSGEQLLVNAVTRRDDDFLLQRSTKALGAIKSTKGVEPLVAVVDHGNARGEKWLNNSRYAVQALGQIGGAEAVAAMEKMLAHEDFRMRVNAAAALEKIDGRKREYAADGPVAKLPDAGNGPLATPGGKRPPQFILLGVDDCTNIDGLESMLDICETLRAGGSKAVFTMWLAPLAGSSLNNDIEKRKVLYQYLFDLGCEVAHHTLHHNPGGRNWASLSRDIQIEEIEGCTQWYRDNIEGFTRPFSFKGGGGGQGSPAEREFTQQLLARQNFIYRGRRGGHPNEFAWPDKEQLPMVMPGVALDASGVVHEKITDPIFSDYPGRFDYEVAEGVAMWKANFEYRYAHPLRPPLVVNAFHDWALRDVVGRAGDGSLRNEGKILKAFLTDVLVTNKDKYPDTYCITFRQWMEYVRTGGDLEQALAIGNGQDKRSKVKPSIE